jgi:seryl-tRNA(Sec) selenium transferase
MNPVTIISAIKPTKLRESIRRLSLIQAAPVAVKVPSNLDTSVIDAEAVPKVRACRIQAFIESAWSG